MKKNNIIVILSLLAFFLLVFNVYEIFYKYNVIQTYFDDIYNNFRNLETVINSAKDISKRNSESTDDTLTDYVLIALYEETNLLKQLLESGEKYIDKKIVKSTRLHQIKTTVVNILKNNKLTEGEHIFLEFYYDAVLNALDDMTEGGKYFIKLNENTHNLRAKRLSLYEFNNIIEEFDNHIKEFYFSIKK